MSYLFSGPRLSGPEKARQKATYVAFCALRDQPEARHQELTQQ